MDKDSDKETGTAQRLPVTIAAFIILSLLAFLGNVYSCPIGFGVNFLFGSVFVVVAVYFLGTIGGGIVALISASHTYQLWNHPYAIIIFTAEAIWIGVCLRRKHRNIVLIDLFYWLLVGLPLVWLFYHIVMKLGNQAALTIFLKQTINGIFNALIAGLIIHHLPLARFLGPTFAKPEKTSYSTIVFNLAAAFVMIPTIALLLLNNHRELMSYQQQMISSVSSDTQELSHLLNDWLTRHIEGVRHIGQLAYSDGLQPGKKLQDHLATVKEDFPNFHNVYVADDQAITVGFYPEINSKGQSTIGLDFSDREYYRRMKAGESHYVSDVFLGRGGVFVPIFVITAPIVDNHKFKGFALGAINLDKLRQVFKYHKHSGCVLTIYDQKGNIICSTDQTRKPLTPLSIHQTGQTIPLSDEVSVWTPNAKKNIAMMETWKDAVFFSSHPIGGTSWRLLAESSVAPMQQSIYQSTVLSLELVFALFVISIIISHFVGLWFIKSPSALADLSRDLPEKIASDAAIVWPEEDILEMAQLTENFHEAATVIQSQFTEIQTVNVTLEKRVQERTAELQALTKSLEAKVEEEVKLRREGEQHMFQQSRLASMGEMIGAIAHQWRQPLNALGLIIQNIKEQHTAGNLDESQLEALIRKAMEHIKLMSRTIDDFRDFFRPDKTTTDFDIVLASGKVVSMFSAQFKSSSIDIKFCIDGRIVDIDSYSSSSPEYAGMTINTFQNELDHVILNLLNNAKEAILEKRMGENSGKQGMVYLDFSSGEHAVIIRVRDNGIGLPKEKDKIYEPYFSTKKQLQGTGMGLYMCKVMVEEHMQGKLYNEDSPEGAVFCLEIPRKKA